MRMHLRWKSRSWSARMYCGGTSDRSTSAVHLLAEPSATPSRMDVRTETSFPCQVACYQHYSELTDRQTDRRITAGKMTYRSAGGKEAFPRCLDRTVKGIEDEESNPEASLDVSHQNGRLHTHDTLKQVQRTDTGWDAVENQASLQEVGILQHLWFHGMKNCN